LKSKLQKVGHVLKTSGIFTLKKERKKSYKLFFFFFFNSRKEPQKFHKRKYLISGLPCLSCRQFKLPCSYLLVNVKVLSKLHRLHIIFQRRLYLTSHYKIFVCFHTCSFFTETLSTHNHIYIAQLYFLQIFYRC
jgi:hypothetical protein